MLPDEAKSVLQAGSVIEREFSYKMIKKVTGLPEKGLLSNLSALKDSEFLYERGIYPESIYVFKHALTREVVYDSILTRKKKRLHEYAGKAIEELYKENIEDYFEALTEHFIYSNNYEKGAEYSQLAGKKSGKAVLMKEAILYLKKRIDCLERMPETEENQLLIADARTALGLHYFQLAEPVLARDAVDPIVDQVIEKNYNKGISRIYLIKGQNAQAEENFPEAVKYLGKAMNIAVKERNAFVGILASCAMGIILSFNCDFKKAIDAFNIALQYYGGGGSLVGVSVIKSFLSACVYNFQGDMNSAFQTSSEALKMAEESEDTLSKSFAYFCHGVSCTGKGYFKEGKRVLQQAVKISEEPSILLIETFAHFALGDILYHSENYLDAMRCFDRAVRLSENSHIFPSFLKFFKVSLIKARSMNDEKNIDLERLYRYVEENQLKAMSGRMQMCVGEILLNLGGEHLPEAEGWIQKAIKTNEENGLMFFLGNSWYLYADFFKRKRNLLKAGDSLEKAIGIYKECGSSGWVRMAEKELTEQRKACIVNSGIPHPES